jgi:hypothetical protein
MSKKSKELLEELNKITAEDNQDGIASDTKK